MKNTILFFFLLLTAAVSAQSNSFVTDRLRAAEYFRIGTNTSQKVTGFDRVITAPGTHDSLPTSRAVVDFLEANFTPIGYYTAGTGISISDDVITNSAPDQVVGLTGGGITVITGTYPNFTITSNEVDGSTTNELQNLSLSGQSLSISSGTGVTLPVVGVAAGTGIDVSGSSGTFTVTNTGDLSATNEIQTLSLSGSELSLSLGGGTVTLPGGADGNGIYSGSGSVVGEVDVTVENVLAFRFASGNSALKFDNGETSTYFSSDDESNTMSLANAGFLINTTNYSVNSLSGDGIQYAAEYPGILTNDRSIPDVGLTKQIVASENGALGTGFTTGGGDGTIPGANVVISGGDFNIDNQASVSISMGDVQGNGQGIGLRLSDITFQFGNPFGAGNYSVISNIDGSDNFISIQTPDKEFKFDATSAKFYDLRATPIGLEYAAEYPDILTNDRSLPDVGTVNLLKQTPVSYSNAAAPNNTIFYSTTDGKLSYKDPAGVVHNLY